jgi:acetolactate synthase-1/3 small subunit
VERELALIKVAGKGEHRVEALRLADVFRARPWTPPPKASFRTDRHAGQDRHLRGLMAELGLVETARTGVVGMTRGKKAV